MTVREGSWPTTALLVAGVFAAVGVAVGVVAFLGVNWAEVQFVAAARGDTATRFGPLFVGVVAFATVLTVFFVGVTLAAVVGLLFGSQYRQPSTAALATGSGSLVGFCVLAVVAGTLVSLALADHPNAQSVTLASLLVPALEASVPTALLGALAGAVGAYATG